LGIRNGAIVHQQMEWETAVNVIHTALSLAAGVALVHEYTLFNPHTPASQTPSE
jgi:hypothetical protein